MEENSKNLNDLNSNSQEKDQTNMNQMQEIKNDTQTTTKSNYKNKKRKNIYNKFAPYFPDKQKKEENQDVKNTNNQENQNDKENTDDKSSKTTIEAKNSAWSNIDLKPEENSTEETQPKERIFYDLKSTNVLKKDQKKQPPQPQITSEKQDTIPKSNFFIDPTKIRSKNDQNEKQYYKNDQNKNQYYKNKQRNSQNRNYNDHRREYINRRQMNYNRNNRRPHLHITEEDINKTKQILQDYYAENAPKRNPPKNYIIPINSEQKKERTPDEEFHNYYEQFFGDDDNENNEDETNFNDFEQFPDQPFFERQKINPFENKFIKEKKESNDKPFMFNDVALQTKADLNNNNFDSIKELTVKQEEIEEKRRIMQENRRKNIPDEVVSFIKPRKTAIQISDQGIFIKKNQDRTDPNGHYVTNNSNESKGFLIEKVPRVMKTQIDGVDFVIERPDREVGKTFVISKKDGTSSTISTKSAPKTSAPLLRIDRSKNIQSQTNPQAILNVSLNSYPTPQNNVISQPIMNDNHSSSNVEFPSIMQTPNNLPYNQFNIATQPYVNDSITSNLDFNIESDDEAQNRKIQNNIKLYKKLMGFNNEEEDEEEEEYFKEEENYDYYDDDDYDEDDDGHPEYSYYLDEYGNEKVRLTHKFNKTPVVYDKRNIQTFPPPKPQTPKNENEQNEKAQDQKTISISNTIISTNLDADKNDDIHDNSNENIEDNALKITVETLPEKQNEDYENPFRQFLQNKIQGTKTLEIKPANQESSQSNDQNELNKEIDSQHLEDETNQRKEKENDDTPIKISIETKAAELKTAALKEEHRSEEESIGEEEEEEEELNQPTINSQKPQQHSISTDKMIEELKMKKEKIQNLSQENNENIEKTEQNTLSQKEDKQISENEKQSTTETLTMKHKKTKKVIKKAKKVKTKPKSKNSPFSPTNFLLASCLFFLIILLLRTYY